VEQNPTNFGFALNCSNKALMALYNLASMLVFPSFEEGFGWPIVEAMACGCPVVTTNKAPMNEIGSDVAVYIDPKNHPNAAQTILDLLKSPESLEAMSQRGLEHSGDFSSEKMLSNYADFFRAAN
jgi:glycosyltransferase involved in cell wall biosynthesis